MVSIARFEGRRKSEREKRANTHRAVNGIPFMGGVRLTGFTQRGELIDDEADLVRELFQAFMNGDTLYSLARRLDEQHVPTRFGGATWNPSSVRGMLTNPRYAGRVRLAGTILSTNSNWPAIVDGELFDAVQRKLADPRRQTNRTGSTARKYLGSGLYLCGVCDTPVTTTGQRYRCPVGAHVTRTKEPIDNLVLAVLRQYIAGTDRRTFMPAVGDDTAARLQGEVARLLSRIDTVENDYDEGLIDGRRYKTLTDKLRSELSDAEGELSRSTAPGTAAGSILGAPDPAAEFENAGIDRQRAFLSAVLTVRLLHSPRGRKGLDPNTVQFEWNGAG